MLIVKAIYYSQSKKISKDLNEFLDNFTDDFTDDFTDFTEKSKSIIASKGGDWTMR